MCFSQADETQADETDSHVEIAANLHHLEQVHRTPRSHPNVFMSQGTSGNYHVQAFGHAMPMLPEIKPHMVVCLIASKMFNSTV